MKNPVFKVKLGRRTVTLTWDDGMALLGAMKEALESEKPKPRRTANGMTERRLSKRPKSRA